MAPDKQILTAISKEDKQMEIQRRLQDHEVQKARRLLAMATGSHFEALKITKSIIDEQINKVMKNGNNGNSNNNSRK